MSESVNDSRSLGSETEKRARAFDAAVALIKSRLRRYVYDHCDPTRVPHRDVMLRFEDSVETESHPAWKRALSEWGDSPSDNLRSTITKARDEAILLVGPMVSTQFDGAGKLIDDFRQEFRVESLLDG